MILHPRPALALLAVAAVSLGTLHSPLGFYTTGAFAAVMAALALGVLALVVRPRPIRLLAGQRDLMPDLLLVVAIALGVAAVTHVQLLYANPRFVVSRISMWIVFGLLVALIPAALGRTLDGPKVREPSRRVLTAVLLVMILCAGLVVRTLVLIASPEPVIDVYSLLRDGADHVIEGKNPYSNDIESPYGTWRAEKFGVGDPPDPRPAGYPPLPLFLSVPPRLLGLDVRWANVVADILAALAIALAGWTRGRPAVGLVAASIYLNLPRAPFIIEQAWYEPMIAALLGLGLILTEAFGRSAVAGLCEAGRGHRPRLQKAGYVLVGLGLTAKQFGLPLLVPLAWARRRDWRWLAVGVGFGVLVMLPCFFLSPRDFLDIVLWKHLGRPPQAHSITIGSFLINEFGVTWPRAIGWLAAAGAMVGIGMLTPRCGAATALGLGTALLAFCVCHTQGFANYFHLVQYLWLLGCVGLLPRGDTDV